jgi:hypothetical protein
MRHVRQNLARTDFSRVKLLEEVAVVAGEIVVAKIATFAGDKPGLLSIRR